MRGRKREERELGRCVVGWAEREKRSFFSFSEKCYKYNFL
jgi:hypothetical protein